MQESSIKRRFLLGFCMLLIVQTAPRPDGFGRMISLDADIGSEVLNVAAGQVKF